MNFFLLDYSGQYFKTVKKISVPRKRGGKFVQIFDLENGNEYVVLSPRDFSTYHANIVERFCTLNKIAGSYNSKKDFFAIRDDAWTVSGGGAWMIDDDRKTLELSGESKAYGAFESGGLKSKILKSGVFPGYSCFVNGS